MKRPWNIVDMPVYSLATYADGLVNMNICTYVSAVSMKPKLFMIAVDYESKSYENLLINNQAVLQILHTDHAKLVPLLGKNSGKNTRKEAVLGSKKLLTQWKNHKVLVGACGYLQLKTVDHTNIGGDHELFYFEIATSSTRSETGVLMFQELIKQGMIL